jgi:hypothetical protein
MGVSILAKDSIILPSVDTTGGGGDGGDGGGGGDGGNPDEISIVQSSKASGFLISPNPAHGIINILPNDPLSSEYAKIQVSLYAMSGQLMLQKEFQSDEHVVLDVGRLKKGPYIIKIRTGGNSFIRKISLL